MQEILSTVAPELDLIDRLEELAIENAREDFYAFVQYAAPHIIAEGFTNGIHIYEICKKLQLVEQGKRKRVMIFLPPRSMKTTISQLFQAWCFGRHPGWQLMNVCYAQGLADDTSRIVRNLIMTPEYQRVFPGVQISADSRAVNKWSTAQGGRYTSAGITGGIAGKGAHIAFIDDPLSEQDAFSKAQREFVKKWYPGGLKSRLMPGGRIVIISTRWHEDDLPGWLLTAAIKDSKADQWDVIEFPAIVQTDKGEESYWPEWRPLHELQALRDDPTTPRSQWNALYMQTPTPEEGNILQRKHFQLWPAEKPLPQCSFVMMSLDTAFSKKETADFSVIQVWGIFDTGYKVPEQRDEDGKIINRDAGREFNVPNAILLSNRRGRWDYTELLDETRAAVRRFQPDRIIIENKASGIILIQDMQRAGFPVWAYSPGKGQDKESRVHTISRYVVGGRVWMPEDKMWADDLVDEACAFPFGRNDDQLDAMTLALLHLRDAWALVAADDPHEDEPEVRKPRLYWH